MGYNLGVASEGIFENAEAIYTIAADYSFNNFGAFLEFYGSTNFKNSNNFFDFGLTYLLNPNFQLDISSGFNLSNSFNQYFISCGISYRILNN